MLGTLQPQAGDVLLNSTGTGTIGRSCVFDGEDRFIVDGHVTLLRTNGRADGRWLNAMFRHPIGQQYLERNCYSGSTNQVELSRTKLAATYISLPDLPEQQRIAEILDTLEEAIRKTEEVIAKLRQMKQGLLHDLLTRGLDDNGELRDPDRHPEQFHMTSLGRLPKGWDVRRLEDWVRRDAPVTYGIVQAGPHVEDGIPYIRTGDMYGDKLSIKEMLRTSPRIANQFRRSEVQAGEIVCAIRATVGKVLPVPAELDGANLTQGTARIAPGRDIEGDFLLWSMRSAAAQKQIASVQKGTTFQEITLGQLQKLLISCPKTKGEQQEIALRLLAHETREGQEQAEFGKLRQLKRGLMDDLLTGRVRVTTLIEKAA